MVETKKWSVTYTKHVKQKRKVYQDGILELYSTTHKVLLYDDCEKLLDSRFVKKDDVIRSGGTLAFDTYLVDIGDLHGDHNLIPNFKSKKSDQGTSDKIGPLHGKKFSNLSPSQKIIREFKKSEIKKYSASPSCLDSPITSLTEWQVLYTAQMTQKAKKFHDGFLRLTICGSQGRQVMLYDATRRLLESKFLKKDEKIISGESLTFDGHLVEIGEPEGDHKTKKNLNFQGTNCNAGGKADIQSGQQVQSHHDSPVEAPKDAPHERCKSSSVRSFGADLINLSGEIPPPMPLRDAHQILSILKKPIIREGMSRVSLEEHNPSQSSECLHSDNHIQGGGQSGKDFYCKILPVGNDGEETVIMHNCSGEISKSKAVDNNLPIETTVLLDNDSREESQSRILSSSHLSLGRTRSDCSIMEHETSSVLLLDLEVRLPAASDWHNGSNKKVDTGDHCELVSFKEKYNSGSCQASREVEAVQFSQPSADDMATGVRDHEGTSSFSTAIASGLGIASSDQFKCDCPCNEEKSPVEQSRASKIDEIPSFDLGF